MKNFFDKLTHPTKTKWFWLYIVGGFLGIILGIMLMPIWNKCQLGILEILGNENCQPNYMCLYCFISLLFPIKEDYEKV